MRLKSCIFGDSSEKMPSGDIHKGKSVQVAHIVAPGDVSVWTNQNQFALIKSFNIRIPNVRDLKRNAALGRGLHETLYRRGLFPEAQKNKAAAE